MSGTGYNYAQQLVATDFSAWLAPQQLVPGQDAQQQPNLIFGVTGSPLSPVWFQSVLAAWQPVDPLPTLPRFGYGSPQGAGASFTQFHPVWQHAVLAAWV